jgi:hypothetical protein
MADKSAVVSDIDDVVRVTKVYVPTTGLKNSFAEPYVNIAGMPELYAHWMQTLPGAALHFDTTTPLELSTPGQRLVLMPDRVNSSILRGLPLRQLSAGIARYAANQSDGAVGRFRRSVQVPSAHLSDIPEPQICLGWRHVFVDALDRISRDCTNGGPVY